MLEPEFHDDPTGAEYIAGLRAYTARLPAGSLEWRWNRCDLAARLLDRANDDDSGPETGPGAVGRLRALAEPEQILDQLRATGPEPGEYRRLCLLSARAAAVLHEVTGDPRDGDTVIGWLERAAADFTPSEPLLPDDPWWGHADTVAARCDLALELALRWDSTPREHKGPDADRIVALLVPLLDGSDADLLPDPGWCHACLGLVLCSRYQGPEPVTPARLADRAASIRHLREAHADDGLDPGLRAQVLVDLVMLLQLDWCDREEAAADGAVPAPDTAELTVLFDLLRPLLDDRGETGGIAAELGGDVADALSEHADDQAAQRAATDWYRTALEHPGIDAEARIRISLNLGLALSERAQRNDGTQAADDPSPETDRAEALALLDRLLDTLGPGSARTACLAGVLDLLWRLLDGPEDASALDRVVLRGRELVGVLTPDDEDRAQVVLRSGIALGRRVQRDALPYANALANGATAGADPRGIPPLERSLPEVAAGLETAIDLLRTGTGLYHYDDDLYLVSATVLGALLVLDFAARLPEVRIGRLHEGLRRLRTMLERLPTDSDLRGSDLTGTFTMAVMYNIWFSAPFHSGRLGQWGGDGDLPDPTGFASVEDDIRLLGRLLEDPAAGREPVYEFLCAMLVVLRSPDGVLTTAELRTWQPRLRHAADTTEPEAWGLVSVLLAMSGAFGLELALRGQASATESAAATSALYDARSVAPPGTPLRQMVDGMLARVGRPDPLSLLQGIFGGAPAATGAAPSGAAPSGAAPSGGEPQAEPFEAVEFDADVAVLVGDGSADPFAVPAGRAIELLSAHPDPLSAPGLVTLGMVRYHRWLRERDNGDLGAAVSLVREAHGVLAGGAGTAALGDRTAALLAGMLLDRHLLLGDHADLEAADGTYRKLLDGVPRGVRHPALPVLLAEAAEPGERGLLRQLFLPVADEPGPFRAELLAAAGTTGPLRARLGGAAPDRAALSTAVGHLREAERTLPARHHRLPAVRSELGLHALEDARARDDRDALRAAVQDVVAAAADCPADSPHRAALLLRAAGALYAEDAAHADAAGHGVVRLDQGIDLLRRAVDEGGHRYHGARARCHYGLGLLLGARYRRAGDPDDLDAAAAALHEAGLAQAPGQGDSFPVVLNRALALVYRAYGPQDRERRRQSLETGRSVLAAHGRSVLLQTGASNGLDAARAVGADMMRLVGWCIADDRPDLAFEAVELGRGLVLNAATVDATVPDLLRDEGHHELAAAWESSVEGQRGDGPISVPDDLRGRVLEALTGSPAERRLLSAPTPAQVRGALRQVGADALVHLVPGEAGPGHALVVTVTGTVCAVELPGLRDLDAGPLGAYNRALRDFQEAGRPENRPKPDDPPVLRSLHRLELAGKEKNWRQCLDELSVWAGTAAMDGLLDWAEPQWPGRPPRLVLAPVGALGVVPWHAARCADRTGQPTAPAAAAAPDAAPARPAPYAVQRAELSYCATARQLLEVVARPRIPLATGARLLVVDPTGSETMHREARLVHDLFGSDAVVVGDLGRRSEHDGPWAGPAPLPPTPAAVNPYLPGRGVTSAALSHVNCHADTGRTAADSVLKLDRTNRLTVTDLLAGAHDRDPAAPGGIVVLANCVSDLALSDHDEALTLSTAVLGAGACTVVGSRWAILDDLRTTLLMGCFHLGLKAGSRPKDALRAAQLWMLDPGRTVPPELAGIAAAVPDTAARPWSELEVWASFTHHGR